MTSDRLRSAWVLLLSLTACGGAGAPPAPAPATPAASGGSGAAAKDPAKVRGRLPPEVIQKVVRADFGAMKRCYEEALGRDPTVKGKVTTKFVIARDGTVAAAADVHDAPPTAIPGVPPDVVEDLVAMHGTDEPRFPDKKVTDCVVSRFKALTFPPPEGGVVTVVYPIVFNPGD